MGPSKKRGLLEKERGPQSTTWSKQWNILKKRKTKSKKTRKDRRREIRRSESNQRKITLKISKINWSRLSSQSKRVRSHPWMRHKRRGNLRIRRCQRSKVKKIFSKSKLVRNQGRQRSRRPLNQLRQTRKHKLWEEMMNRKLKWTKNHCLQLIMRGMLLKPSKLLKRRNSQLKRRNKLKRKKHNRSLLQSLKFKTLFCQLSTIWRL